MLMAKVINRSAVTIFVLLLTSASFAKENNYQLEVLAENLHHPWSVANLPEGEFLITERRGKLLRVSSLGHISEVSGVPATYVAGQGGFFDILTHPQFDSNQLVYLAYAKGGPQANGLAVIRARLAGDQLQDLEQIFMVNTLKDTPQHYGGRMVFLPDGSLLIATGEGFDYREKSQDIQVELGKVLRVNDDGTVPDNNPFSESGAERVWTFGHRNTQGLVVDRTTGSVYLHEHGPKGGDELNLLVPGKNYGWPAITYGLDYSGAHVSPYTSAQGMEQPLKYWSPSIAPSGIAWYDGDLFPEWKGDLFVGALVDREVRRVTLENGLPVAEEALFSELGERIRDVRYFEDGYLYLLTDSPSGQFIRVKPLPVSQ